MKNLIISDAHLGIDKVKTILAKEKYDKVYFLGDFFDNWNDNAVKNAEMAKYLNQLMTRDDFYFIFGNHCMNYFWDIPSIRCGGYEYTKYLAINNFLNRKAVMDKFKFFHVVDGWLLTHAGLHAGWLPAGRKNDLTDISEYLFREQQECLKKLDRGNSNHWFLSVGRSRGGYAPFGGILWCDAFEEFAPIPGIKQVFGHTFCGIGGRKNEPFWIDNNVDIDTSLDYYAIIEDGKLEIKEYSKLI